MRPLTMGFKLGGLFGHFVLVLVLLEVQSRTICTTSTPRGDFNRTIKITKPLENRAKDLLKIYLELHKDEVKDKKVGVPTSEISGDDACQKLQDVYTKSVLFYQHISKVQEYNGRLGNRSIAVLLSQVKGSLYNLSAQMKAILQRSVPATAAPPQLSHGDDFAKREYGWAVIDTLKEWIQPVLQLLEEAKADPTPPCSC